MLQHEIGNFQTGGITARTLSLTSE